jgi:hypothetical protein
MNRRRKLFLTSMVVAVLAAALGFGSFATFNAQTNNPGNTFAEGTIVLSNTKQGNSPCLSTGGGTTDTNLNVACNQLINAITQKPGQAAVSANVTLQNVGSLNASVFKLFSPACADANASAETYHGTGSLCSQLQLTIQQYSDAAFTTPSACLYGHATGNVCDFTDATKTLGAFTAAYPNSAGGLSLGSLAAGASAYFTVSIQSPSGATNTVQGRQASLDFDWYIAQ